MIDQTYPPTIRQRPKLALRELVADPLNPIDQGDRRARVRELRNRILLLDPADLEAELTGEQYVQDMEMLFAMIDELDREADRRGIPRELPLAANG